MEQLDLCALLRQNSYPGRGILAGRTETHTVAAYFIMGRSENSRNRVFEATPDGIRTRAFDESKMTDPSLIIYHPVRQLQHITIVTNGDQTDTIRDYIDAGGDFEEALYTRTFEPDGPNWTPRISAMLLPWRGKRGTGVNVQMSILKSLDGDPACCCRQFFAYQDVPVGTGFFLSTYQGDGAPLPSFAGEPLRVAVTAPDADTLADRLWESLNGENKVALFVQYAPLDGPMDGSDAVRVLRNKLG